MNGIEKAIKICGGPSALARRLKVNRQVINHWKNIGYVPSARTIDVNEVTDVPLHELNPSVYPKDCVVLK